MREYFSILYINKHLSEFAYIFARVCVCVWVLARVLINITIYTANSLSLVNYIENIDLKTNSRDCIGFRKPTPNTHTFPYPQHRNVYR